MSNKTNVLLVGWGVRTMEYIFMEYSLLSKKYNFYIATTSPLPVYIKKYFKEENIIYTDPYNPVKICQDVSNFCHNFNLKFNIVIPVFDMCVIQAATLSKYLGISKALPLDVALSTSSNKYLMRTFANKIGFNQPKYVKFNIDSIDLALEFIKNKPNGCVIKPIRSISSYGARYLPSNSSKKDLEKIISDAAGDFVINNYDWFSLEKWHSTDLLIEEYIEGKVYSFDGLIGGDGKVFFFGNAEFESSTMPLFYQIGQTIPLASLNKEQIKICEKSVESLVKKMGICFSFFHCELKFINGKPLLIEIGARVPGSVVMKAHQDRFDYSLFDLYLSKFTLSKEPLLKKEVVDKTESVLAVVQKNVFGYVSNQIPNGVFKEKDYEYTIHSQSKGYIMYYDDSPRGGWLYEIKVTSSLLDSKKVKEIRDRLIKENKVILKNKGLYFLYIKAYLVFIGAKYFIKKYILRRQVV